MGLLLAEERPPGVVHFAQNHDLLQTEPCVQEGHEGATVPLVCSARKDVYPTIQVALDGEHHACSEHFGIHLACSLLVPYSVAAADFAAVGVPLR